MFGKHNRCPALKKNNTLADSHVVPSAAAMPPPAGKGQIPPQKLYNSGF